MITVLTPLSPSHALHPVFVAALAAESLPTDDLKGGARFSAHTVDGIAVAFGGLEGEGADQLLGSVVAPPNSRGGGHGQRIAGALTREARAAGAERQRLLTTSAVGCFARIGWAVTGRPDAPEVIRNSRQFSGLCPATAVLMCQRLA